MLSPQLYVGCFFQVPGLPQRIDFPTSNELCSVANGNLFHVKTLTEWLNLNSFLVGLGKSNFCIQRVFLYYILKICLTFNVSPNKGYTDTYWTGVAAEGHPGLWVVRSTGEELNTAAVEFKAGAPSNSSDKLCLAIEYQASLGRYQWVDYPCSDKYVIVCEARC